MKRPLAYITAAWSGNECENAEAAARYCRQVYEAGYSPICPILFTARFIHDGIPQEHKDSLDIARDYLRRSRVLVVCGRRYFLLDMVRKDEVGVDTQDYTDTITMDSDTNDLSAILKQLEPHREVTTEDGHSGLLALDYTSVTVEAKGYKTSTRSLSATRTYPSLSDANLDLIPKTITDGGRTLTLGAVEWSGGENGFYTATASYIGTASSRHATGYTVTASYTGQVSKTDYDVVTYTAIFGSEELAGEGTDPQASGQPETTPAPDAAPAETSGGLGLLPVLIGVGGGAVLAVALLWAIQYQKGRRIRT